MVTLPVSCRCGEVRGALRLVPGDARRLRCHCDDCQAWARHLGLPDLVDGRGGTEIVQTSPAHLSFEAGIGELACARLGEGGMNRWFARCCRTPIANTLATGRAPFVGIVTACLPERTGVEVLPEVGIQGRFARGGPPPGVASGATPGTILEGIRLIARWWWRGDASRSPFFDAAGRPCVEPVVLTAEELAKARGGADVTS